MIADRKATLAYLANSGVITIHGALSKEPQIRAPDKLIFDLDPSVDDFSVIQHGARVVREVLEDLGLACFIQTTGSRGLHVVAPLRPERDFDEVAGFARRAAALVVARDPDSFTIERLKKDRGDRLLIDYFRNAWAQTAVVPYSVRPKTGAPVATPLEWDELDELPRGAATYDIHSVRARLAARGDAWSGMSRRARSLERPLERLERLSS